MRANMPEHQVCYQGMGSLQFAQLSWFRGPIRWKLQLRFCTLAPRSARKLCCKSFARGVKWVHSGLVEPRLLYCRFSQVHVSALALNEARSASYAGDHVLGVAFAQIAISLNDCAKACRSKSGLLLSLLNRFAVARVTLGTYEVKVLMGAFPWQERYMRIDDAPIRFYLCPN